MFPIFLIIHILKADEVFSRELRSSEKENCSDLNDGNINKIDFDHLQALVRVCYPKRSNDTSNDPNAFGFMFQRQT